MLYVEIEFTDIVRKNLIKKKITPEQINYDFIKLKNHSIKLFNKNKIDQSLKTIEVACNLMYNTNIKYVDDDLENLVVKISKQIFKNEQVKMNVEYEDNKIVFYDYFALDNRGLTQQYLRGLMDLNYEILYITYRSNDKSRASNITKELDEYGKSKLYYIKNENNIRASMELYYTIKDFKSNKALIHTSPFDMIGLVTFAFLENKINRFLINITDHAFWLGKSSADYFIEFRSYGFNLSEKHRGIEKKKLMMLPYYPIQYHKIEFQGFAFDSRSKKIIFSGGSLYKIYGSNFFFNTIKHILDIHKDIIFLYAGNGDAKPLNNFIKRNGFQNRFFYINERKDITQIFKRIYLYLDTYPISGGLMAQYAVVNGKLPISFRKKESSSKIENLFINSNDIKFTFTDEKSYLEELDKLISDPKYLRSRELQLPKLLINEIEFSKELNKCITEGKTKFTPDRVDIDIDSAEAIQTYLDLVNNYPTRYYGMFVKRCHLKLGILFPNYFIRGFFGKLLNKIRGAQLNGY